MIDKISVGFMLTKLSVLKEHDKFLSGTLFIYQMEKYNVMHMILIVKVLSLKSERKMTVKKFSTNSTKYKLI